MTRQHARLSVRWLIALLGLVPIAGALMLLTTHIGRRALKNLAPASTTVSVLPGMTVEEAAPPAHGLVVTSRRSNGAAVEAGISVGDNITAIDYHPIKGLNDAAAYMRHDRRPIVTLTILHDRHMRRMALKRSGESHGA